MRFFCSTTASPIPRSALVFLEKIVYTIVPDCILESMRFTISVFLLSAIFPGLLLAQEKTSRLPSRPHQEDRNERPGAREESAGKPEARPQVSAQEKAIEESWMKELRGEGGQAGNPESGQPAVQPGAAEPETTQPVTPPGAIFAEDAAPSFFGLLFRFILIAGLMGGGLYLFVRFFKKKAGILNAQEGPIEVLASVPLMPGKFLQIVDLAGQLLVLGVSEQGVRLVYEINSATTAERIRLWHQSRPKPTATSLLDAIQKSIKQGEFRFWGGEQVMDRPDFMDLLNGEKTGEEVPPDRLKELLQMQNRKIRRSTKPEEEGL